MIISQGSWVRMTLETKEGLRATYDLAHLPDGSVSLTEPAQPATLKASLDAEGTLGVVRGRE